MLGNDLSSREMLGASSIDILVALILCMKEMIEFSTSFIIETSAISVYRLIN